MKRYALEESIAEAARFLARARKLALACGGKDTQSIYDWPVMQGETVRASLDLTRSLARLRKS